MEVNEIKCHDIPALFVYTVNLRSSTATFFCFGLCQPHHALQYLDGYNHVVF